MSLDELRREEALVTDTGGVEYAVASRGAGWLAFTGMLLVSEAFEILDAHVPGAPARG